MASPELDFNPQPTPEDVGLNFYASPASLPVTPELVASRAVKAHFGLGELSPGLEQLQTSLSTRESDRALRREIVQQEVAGMAQLRNKMVQEAAVRVGSMVTPSQAAMLRNFSTYLPTADPDTALERAFAEKYTSTSLFNNPRGIMNGLDVSSQNRLTDAVYDATGKMEYFRKVSQDLDDEGKQQSTFGVVSDFVEGIVPFLSSYRQRALTAGQLQEEAQRIWSLPLEQAKIEVDKRVAELKASSLSEAKYFVDTLFGMARSTQLEKNLFTLLDVLDVGAPAAKGAVKLSKLAAAAVRGVSDEPIKLRNTFSELGDLEKAGTVAAVDRVKNLDPDRPKAVLQSRDPLGHAMDLSDDLPLIFNPASTITLNPGALAREAADRITAALQLSAKKSAQVAFNMLRIDRTPPEAQAAMVREAKELFPIQYPRVADGIIQMDHIPAEDLASNAGFLSVQIGKRDGTLFRTATAADNYAQKEYGLNIERYTTGKTQGVVAKGEVSLVPTSKKTLPEALYNPTPGTQAYKIMVGKSHKGYVEVGYNNEAKRIWIHWAGTPGLAEKSLVNALGPAAVRSLLRQLKGEFPEAESVAGLRVTGARGDKTGRTEVDISKIQPEIGKPSTTVVQHGDGWYIQITKPLDEVSPSARDALTIPTDNVNPVSAGNMFLGMVRGSRELQAPFQVGNKQIVTNVPQEVRRLIQEMVEPIGKLRKESYNQLQNILHRDLNFTDYNTGKHGMRSHSQVDLEERWLDVNKRLPTEKESLAYWTYHQLMETDLAIRNMGMKRDIDRLGVEMWAFNLGNEQGRSPFFFGKFVREPDWHAVQDWGVWIHHGSSGRFANKIDGGKQLKDEIQRLVHEENYQVIQIPNYTDKPLRDLVGDNRSINYLIAKSLESKPTPARLVDKNDGVHIVYPHNFKVVQAKIQTVEKGKIDNFGDETITLHDRDIDAKDFAKKFDELRLKFKNGDTDIDDFIDRHMPMDKDFWQRQFGKDGRLSLDVPITATRLNVSALDSSAELQNYVKDLEAKTGTRLLDHTKSPYNLFRQVDTSFLQERDMPALEGTVRKSMDSPIYHVQRASVLDPMAALQKGVANATKSLHMNDMKISSIEQWAAQYSGVLRNSELGRRNPLWSFYHGELNPDAPRDQYLSALWTRNRIKQFIGQSTELGRTVNYVEAKLFDMMPVGTAKWFATHQAPLISDPTQYARKFMLHSYFGMFNPLQYWVQVQGVAHAVAVAGARNGLPAMAATVLQRLGLQFTENPKILDYYARVAAKMGFGKAEWFKEAYALSRETGFRHVGGEYALDSNTFDPKLIRSTANRVLDAGLAPFREGEKQARLVSFNAAYLEWRRANPNAEMSRDALQSISLRANTFNNNMTRAGNSALEEGVLSVPFQFTTWHRRLIDQMWGSELSKAEKARAMIVHSTLYGIPMGVGIAVPWPIYDEWRKEALERGVKLSDGFNKLMFDGLYGTINSWIFGEEYDFSRRSGPSNTTFIYDFIKGDKSFLETMSGPLGTYLASFGKASFPLYMSMYSAFKADPTKYSVTLDDILDPIKQVTAAHNIYKAIWMVNAGRYLNRNEETLATDANWLDAINLVMFGTQRQRWRDIQLAVGSQKDRQEAQRYLQNLAVQDLHKAYSNLAGDNDALFMKHFNNAKFIMEVYGDFDDKLISETLQKGSEVDPKLLAKAWQKFNERGYKKDLPAKFQRIFDTP